jgi:hypothetical protein
MDLNKSSQLSIKEKEDLLYSFYINDTPKNLEYFQKKRWFKIYQ